MGGLRNRLHWRPFFLLVALTLTLSACGGGSTGGSGPSGSGSPPPPSIGSSGGNPGGGSSGGATLVVTPTTVSVLASDVGSAPTATLQVAVEGTTQGIYYVMDSFTQNGIASGSTTVTSSMLSINLTFKDPAALGIGVYNDTVTIDACSDPGCTEQISGSPKQIPITYTVTLPGPTISSLQPDQAFTGESGFTLTVTGTGFTPQSVVQWNGAPMPTTYVSATALTTVIPTSDLAQPSTVQVTVSNQAANTPVSNFINYAITAQYLGSISPTSATAGAPGFTLTIQGEFFTPNSVVYWNSTALPTTFVSTDQLTATVNAADLASAGSVSVHVAASQGSSVGSTSTVFTIEPLASLALASVSPTSVRAEGGPFLLTVLGNGFTGSSIVQWNGSARTTQYVSAQELVAQIDAADITATGTATVDVQNPGATSGTAPVSIVPQSKDAVAFQITPSHSGVVNFNNLTLPTAATWSTDVGGSPSYAVIADGKVFVTVDTTQQSSTSSSSELLALDQATGAKDWGPIGIGGISNATYDGGTLFVTSSPSNGTPQLEAYDPATGALKWTLALSGTSSISPPTAENGLVYTTNVAVNESSQAVAWNGTIGEGFSATPTVTVDGVYSTAQCYTYDYRPATGEVIWSNLQGCSSTGGPTAVVANGVLYASGSNTEFNAETGAVLGTYSADYPPAIGSQAGYFLSGGTLNAIDLANSTVLWTFTGDGQLATSPIVVDQYVFIGSSSGNLYALNATTGQIAWQTNLGAAIPTGETLLSPLFLSGLSAGDGLLVIPAGTKVTAYTLSTNP